MIPYFVSTDGETFVRRDGQAGYLFRLSPLPQEYRPATKQEQKQYDEEHERIWSLVSGNIPLGFSIAHRYFDLYDEETINRITIDKLLQCARGYDRKLGVAKFSTYARKALYRAFQQESRRKTFLRIDDVENSFSINEKCEYDDVEEIEYLLKGLHPYDRSLLLLYFWKGLTYDELAVKVGSSRSGVYSDLQKAIYTCRSLANAREKEKR